MLNGNYYILIYDGYKQTNSDTAVEKFRSNLKLALPMRKYLSIFRKYMPLTSMRENV